MSEFRVLLPPLCAANGCAFRSSFLRKRGNRTAIELPCALCARPSSAFGIGLIPSLSPDVNGYCFVLCVPTFCLSAHRGNGGGGGGCRYLVD